ncbi:methylated-DNA--[protein]-cysteine S-methyltransferase [Telmatobacter sp. DSM 110680]|uniref:Methylated-DNA--protein-cysteine methyltransferase n=1 Tax=Telmatobacter sp. DSM 110680 TaxID=3036704 RepID=A0AAU7DMW1_9BACT
MNTAFSQPLCCFVDRVATPIGVMMIAADADGKLRVALFTEDEEDIRRYLRLQLRSKKFTLEPANNPYGLMSAISSYFAGELGIIDTLPVETGGTPFQQDVWRALRSIPCGSTISYGALAAQIARPAAVRAVGLANGSNPVAVVVPCHRVIGANGSLTGYGGGIERKRWLLDHEKNPRLF